MQKLSDMYNTHIIRSYQAAGHGKDLADAMYNFCVKPILHRDEFAFNALFYDWMLYSLVDSESVGSFRQCKDVIAIIGCVVGQLFVYEPISKNALVPEYLCDCKNCLLLGFQNWLNIIEWNVYLFLCRVGTLSIFMITVSFSMPHLVKMSVRERTLSM